MDKMKFESPNLTTESVAKLAELFPGVVAEGKVNIDLLRSYVGEEVFADEAYEFTWVGKRAAIAEAGRPIRKTLRPCVEESKDWDTTENLYIEGDNLDVLKLLQESYLGKVKIIYIDPPYNTGNDFIYRDDFKQSLEEYEDDAGAYDEDGDRLFKNTETNGRFHSDWCSMMYPRLVLARNLLSNDGAIFLSIDDNEIVQLRKLCDEVFGESNFIAQLIWERAYAPKNDAKYISNSHDYVLMYAKNIPDFTIGRLERTDEANARYANPDNDPRGVWKASDLSVKTYSAANDYPITAPSGRVIEPPAGRCWRLSKKAFFERLQDNRIWFGSAGNSVPSMKRFLTELKHDGMAPTSIMFYKAVGHSQEGAKEVTALLEAGAFDGPKPIRLVERLLTLANLHDDSIVLDFFSGSSSTAHATMKMNIEKDKRCRFIMVQLPEATVEDGTAYKAGFKNICEIGKERIRRAGTKIKDEAGLIAQDLDIGFRVLKLDSSNMKDVYYTPDKLGQMNFNLDGFVDNIKPDRSGEDLLFQVMLELGIPLSAKITQEDGLLCVNDNYLIACFDRVDTELITEIAKKKPYYAVFRDSSFANDSAMVNFEQVFNTYSPNTIRRVL